MLEHDSEEEALRFCEDVEMSRRSQLHRTLMLRLYACHVCLFQGNNLRNHAPSAFITTETSAPAEVSMLTAAA